MTQSLQNTLCGVLLTALFATISFCGPAQADEYVTCLQQQLKALGQEPGAIDGLWGKQTKAAALALRTEIPSLQTNPYLNNANRQTTISWCRELGIEYFKARPYWPSMQTAEFRYDQGILFYEGKNYMANNPEFWRSKIRDSTVEFRNHLRFQHGIELASRVDVVIGEDPKQISKNLNQLMQESDFRPTGIDRTVRKHCAGENHLNGGTISRWVYLCASKSFGLSKYPEQGAFAAIFAMGNVLAHEYVHVFQNEYSLYQMRLVSGANPRDIKGPLWLSEGAAVVISNEFSQRKNPPNQLIQFRRIYDDAFTSKRALSEITEMTSSDDYAVPHFAVYLLAQRYGSDAILDYWRLIGQGHTTDGAFRELFEMSINDYETLFEDLRYDSLKAIAFMKGNG